MDKNPVSVHVRRGDYLNDKDYHPVCSREYYDKAFSMFSENTSYLLFSDDIEWCKKNFIGKDFYFAEDNEYGFDEPEILETELEDVHENERYVFETDIKVPAKGSANWLKQNLSGKSELKKLMVLKEVLGEPRSIKPYKGDYFQSISN